MYWIGMFMMVYNLYKTAKAGKFIPNEAAEALPLSAQPVTAKHTFWHRWIESRPIQMLVIALVLILIGGMVELIPMLTIKSNIPTISSVKPYTPLELQGRDLYIREGCNNCHSQMIRPFRSETERYGEYSKAGEFVYDHPFLWGSKRTGPDIHREGGKYPNAWQYNHLVEPSSMSPGTIMPGFPWLADNVLDTSYTRKKIQVMRTLGVPYEEGYEYRANGDLHAQAEKITQDLNANGVKTTSDKEIIALIAYLQRLGIDIKAGEAADAAKAAAAPAPDTAHAAKPDTAKATAVPAPATSSKKASAK